MIEFLIVTLAAFTITRPAMFNPSMTVPGVVIVRSPLYGVSTVPAGTRVVPGPGKVDGARGPPVGHPTLDVLRAPVDTQAVEEDVAIFRVPVWKVWVQVVVVVQVVAL